MQNQGVLAHAVGRTPSLPSFQWYRLSGTLQLVSLCALRACCGVKVVWRRGADSGELGAVREAMDFKRGSTNQQIVQSIQHDTNSLVGAATLGNILALSKFLGYIARLNTQL